MHDIKITNALIVDGRGTQAWAGELAIKDGRIAALGTSVAEAAQTTLDAKGHFVAPGFIDLHTHCLPGLCENFLQAGVTSVIGGNCGFSPLDMADVAVRCSRACGPNLGMLVGHNSVRIKVMGNVARKPVPAELAQMCALVEQAMTSGALGLSSGLTYVPGNYAQTDEVVELARVASRFGGYYASHMRNEAHALLDSIRETAEIGRLAGLPAHVSHIKVAGMKNWGKSADALRLLDDLCAGGLDITQDQYPYTASCGRILLLFPQWAQEGGEPEMRARLADQKQRSRLKEALITRLNDYYGGDSEQVVVASAPDLELAGRSLAELSVAGGRSVRPDDVAERVMEIVERFPSQTAVYCVFHGMSEDDVKMFMRHPRTSVASDAWTPKDNESRPHPRMFGTCPRVLGYYARGQGVFSVEEAVRRMTSLPAERLKLNDRGVLREGAWADIVVFDQATIIDRATFEAPQQYPLGIEYVLVNGVLTLDHGRHTGALPGVFLALPRK